MERLDLLEAFVAHFDTESILYEHQQWLAGDMVMLESRLETIEKRLAAKKLSRPTRKKLVIARNKIRHDLKATDPRVFSRDEFDVFMQDCGLIEDTMSGADTDRLRHETKMAIVNVVCDSEAFIATGLKPFLIDFEGSNVTWKIKTIEDYTRDLINTHGAKTETSLVGKKKAIELYMDLMDSYGAVPEDLKLMAAIYREHSLEFSIRVARLQDEMMQNTLRVYTSGVKALEDSVGAGVN